MPWIITPAQDLSMDALFISSITVALAEMGDKTQLLSLLLACRFKNKAAIIAGILLATLVNHGLSAWFGNYLIQFIDSGYSKWLLAGSFIAVGGWLLIPDQDEDRSTRFDHLGAFVVTTVLFFLAEIGDKTQVATVLLGAQYTSVFWVTLGTTLGMLLANVPVIYLQQHLMQRIPFKATRIGAALLFIAMGVFSLVVA